MREILYDGFIFYKKHFGKITFINVTLVFPLLALQLWISNYFYVIYEAMGYPGIGLIYGAMFSTTVVLTEKAIAFCNDKTETWLDVAFANKTKPKYESTEQLVAKGLFPGGVALPEPSRASQSPAAFECSQALEGTPPLFSEVRRDSLCPHDG